MRFLSPCSLVLQLLLICSRGVAGQLFPTCGEPALCVVTPACNVLSPGTSQLERIKPLAGVKPACNEGVHFEVIPADDLKVTWGCPVGMDNCAVRLKIGSAAEIFDINPHGKTGSWPVKMRKVEQRRRAEDFTVTKLPGAATGVFAVRIHADTFDSSSTDMTMPNAQNINKVNHVHICLGLLLELLVVCIYGDNGTEQCTKPFSYFKNACKDARFLPIRSECSEATDNDCRPPLRNTGTILREQSCAAHFSLLYGSVEVISMSCSEDGWIYRNGQLAWDFTADAGRTLFPDVACKNQCSKIFVFPISDKVVIDDKNQISCIDGRILSAYKIYSETTQIKSRETLKCEPGEGWEETKSSADGVPPMKLTFGTTGASMNVDCIDSCTEELIDNTCNGRPGCLKPKMVNEKVTCTDDTTILYLDEPGNKGYYKNPISCTKYYFTAGDNDHDKKVIRRSTLSSKIKVACISKCDPELTKKGDNCNPVNEKCIDETTDPSGYRVLQCRDPSHHIELNSIPQISPMTCNPKEGWTIPGQTIISFDDKKNIQVKADCINACHNRVEAVCSKVYCYKENSKPVVPFVSNSKEYKCPDEYLMLANGEEMINEVLKCSRVGLKKSDGSDMLKFDPAYIATTLKVECVSKCHPDFVTMTPVGQRKTPFTFVGESYKKLECANENEVLLINDHRIFGELNCDKDGWKFQSTNIIAPFSATSVKVKAECVNVCVAEDTCNDLSFCKKMTDLDTQPLQCEGNDGIYSLFFNGQQTSGQVACTNKDWRDQTVPKPLIDFTDTAVKIKDQTVKVECVKLCSMSLIDDLCTDGRTDCEKMNSFSAADGSVKCGSSVTFALFVNGLETTGAVTCSKDGWKQKQPTTGDQTDLVVFTNVLSAHPQKVTVECRKVCGLSLMEDLCTNELRDAGDCRKMTYNANDQTVSCGSDGTYAKYVNDQEWTGTVSCRRTGWFEKDNSGGEKNIVSFENDALISANPPQKVKVECRKLCGSSTFMDTCANESTEKCKNTIVEEKLTAGSHAIKSCKPSDTHVLFVGDKKTIGAVTCTSEGWFDGASPLLKFQDPAFPAFAHPSSSVRVVCRELCGPSLIDDECKDGAPKCAKIDKFIVNEKVTCQRPNIHSLFVNGEERTGDVKCTTAGWTEMITNKPTETIVVFKDAHLAAPNVQVHCKHQCHQDFVDDACQTDDESCSKATYNSETGVLSCTDLPNEILVIEIDGKFHESKEGTATCKDDGWLMTSAPPPVKPTKFEVHAKCLKVCHPNTLNDQTADPFHKVNYTQLAVGGTLTCNAKDEMLEFDDKATYSDLRCTKENGWLMTLGDMKTPLIDFAPMKDRPPISLKVKCVKNLCTDRPFKPFCNEDAGNLCQEPDMASTKYHMKCTSPLVIVRNYNPATPPIIHGDLVCRDGKWLEEKNAQVIFGDLTEDPVIDVKCIADKCTKCKENLKTIACSDQNCMSISFAAGKSSYCTSYKCASGNAFKFIDGNGVVTYQYNVNNEKAAIWCLGDNRFEYKSTDPSSDVDPRAIKTNDQVGCVKQIPCTEVSPLNLECPSNVLCESDLIKKLQANEKTDKPANNENHVQCAADTADKKYEMFYHDSGTKWRPASNLHCDPTGKWSAAIKKGERLDKIELPSKARIVCANKDPTEDQMIVISICDRCRPDAEEKVKQMKKGKCDGCSSDNGLFFNIEGDACVAKGSDGEIVYGDGETTNKIYCRKTTDGVEWKTNDGKVLAQFAGKESSTKIEYGLIGGITGAFLLIIIIGLAAFFYVKHDQKKKAAALEAAKSKGLTQKIDTIIDEVSVTDDVKTLVL